MKLNWFNDKEFGNSLPHLPQELLVRLDALRGAWGKPIRISPAKGTLARFDGKDGTSQHNVDKWGECRAADLMPAGIFTTADVMRFVKLAQDVGFRGIGIYPNWRPQLGFHVDVRHDTPRVWGRIGQRYTSDMVEVYEEVREVLGA